MRLLDLTSSVRRIVPALLLVLVGLGVTAPSPALADASDDPVASMGAATYEKRVQHWVNEMRDRRDLPALRVARCTDRVAERWGRKLARTGQFYHQSMDTVLNRCDARYAGETLGRGAMTPRHLVRLWMESDPHRVVLLSRNARRIGVGAVYDEHGRWVTAANFMRF